MATQKYQVPEELQQAFDAGRIPITFIYSAGAYNAGETIGMPAKDAHIMVARGFAGYHPLYVKHLEKTKDGSGEGPAGVQHRGSPMQFGALRSAPGEHNGNDKGQVEAITPSNEGTRADLRDEVGRFPIEIPHTLEGVDQRTTRQLAMSIEGKGRRYQDVSLEEARNIITAEQDRRRAEDNQRELDASEEGEGGGKTGKGGERATT